MPGNDCVRYGKMNWVIREGRNDHRRGVRTDMEASRSVYGMVDQGEKSCQSRLLTLSLTFRGHVLIFVSTDLQ